MNRVEVPLLPMLVRDRLPGDHVRRRGDCARLRECELRWIQFALSRDRFMQARCPDACEFFEPETQTPRVVRGAYVRARNAASGEDARQDYGSIVSRARGG